MKDNRSKILNVSMKLFNDKGTSEVSTNHICEALSISPGNLYYHFRSKDEIIVTLFQGMIDKWDQSPMLETPSLENLFHLYERTFEFVWEFRFIHREMASLCQRIEKFNEIFISVQERRKNEIQKFIEAYSKAGIFRSMDKSEIRRLARTIWFFMLYWVAYLETEGEKLTRENIKESIEILKGVIQPYLKT